MIGHGEPARALSDEARARLGAPEAQEGLVPVSMMIAIPMLGDRRWLVYGLGAARGSIDLPRLQGLTLAQMHPSVAALIGADTVVQIISGQARCGGMGFLLSLIKSPHSLTRVLCIGPTPETRLAVLHQLDEGVQATRPPARAPQGLRPPGGRHW